MENDMKKSIVVVFAVTLLGLAAVKGVLPGSRMGPG